VDDASILRVENSRPQGGFFTFFTGKALPAKYPPQIFMLRLLTPG